MKKRLAYFITAITFMGCEQKEVKSVESAPIKKEQAKSVDTLQNSPCGDDLVQQALAGNTCLVCHTDTGIEEVPTSRVDLARMGSSKLLKAIDKLKEENDRQHKELLDTLTNEEVSCLIDFIVQYKEIKP